MQTEKSTLPRCSNVKYCLNVLRKFNKVVSMNFLRITNYIILLQILIDYFFHGGGRDWGYTSVVELLPGMCEGPDPLTPNVRNIYFAWFYLYNDVFFVQA